MKLVLRVDTPPDYLLMRETFREFWKSRPPNLVTWMGNEKFRHGGGLLPLRPPKERAYYIWRRYRSTLSESRI